MASLLLFLPCLLLLIYALATFARILYRQSRSPLHRLRSPPVQSWFMGNLPEMHDQENTNLIARWAKKYGSTFAYHGFGGGCRLITVDPVALAHILGNAYDYPKPDFVRDSLANMGAGHNGLVAVEGEQHRIQVRDARCHIPSLPFADNFSIRLSVRFW